jgi:tRNA threonylcarbamoyladenosine biosynthesis protein TsaB
MAVDSAAGRYSVAVRADELVVRNADRADVADLGELAELALADAGLTFADLELLAVNVGPGNLSSVRNGVAYINGLAFSLGCDVFPVSSLHLLAAEVAAGFGSLPVLAQRRSGPTSSYVAYFPAAGPALRRPASAKGEPQASHAAQRSETRPGEERFRYGELSHTLRDLVPADSSKVVVTGSFRSEAAALLPDVEIIDSGIDTSTAATLCHYLEQTRDPRLVPVASPMTETSPEFTAGIILR